MPISEKIVARIKQSTYDKNFKELMLQILEETNKGNYRYKEAYKKLVDDYIENIEKEGK